MDVCIRRSNLSNVSTCLLCFYFSWNKTQSSKIFFLYLFKLRFKDLSEFLKIFALFYRLAVSKFELVVLAQVRCILCHFKGNTLNLKPYNFQHTQKYIEIKLNMKELQPILKHIYQYLHSYYFKLNYTTGQTFDQHLKRQLLAIKEAVAVDFVKIRGSCYALK